MIYLDYNASSPLVAGALDAMLPFLTGFYGNPSSKHPLGTTSREAVERARAAVAGFLRASEGDIYFTSGGTESIAAAFESALADGKRRMITTAAEHSCTLDAADSWCRKGRGLQYVRVNSGGLMDLDELDTALSGPGAAFVSVIWVNNETGVISAVEEVAALCKRHGALLHVDAVQAPFRVDIDVSTLPTDYLSLSAHKFGGPKGAGVLFARAGSPMSPLVHGHQERGFRGGTENVAGIVGAGEAVRLQSEWKSQLPGVARLRDRLESGILATVEGARVNGDPSRRVAGVTNISFPGRNSADLVSALGLAGVCASAGAACSGSGSPSHVLMAMGLGSSRANGSIRFSFGSGISAGDIDYAIEAACKAYQSTLSLGGTDEQ